MFQNIGTTGFILIVLVGLLLFGPQKLPELGRAFGRTLREFREGAKGIMEEETPKAKEQASTADPSEQTTSAAPIASVAKVGSKRLPD